MLRKMTTKVAIKDNCCLSSDAIKFHKNIKNGIRKNYLLIVFASQKWQKGGERRIVSFFANNFKMKNFILCH